MAMLAEKRKRVKYCLNPNGNEWNNDDNKFGQKLLEKMGWQKGQGLGANNQGITERLKVSYKFDSTGLGFKEKDVTLQQQNDFQTLLSELNSGNSENFENKHTLVSLEEKSKKSRSRVHYKKFTRGKDISRYSSKDLSSILGTGVESNSCKLDNIIESKGNMIYGGSMNSYFERKLKKNTGDMNADVENGSSIINKECKNHFVKDKTDDDENFETVKCLSISKNRRIKKFESNEFSGYIEAEKFKKEESNDQEYYGDCEKISLCSRKRHKNCKKGKDSEQQVSSEYGIVELNINEESETNYDCKSNINLNENLLIECEINNSERKRKKKKKDKKDNVLPNYDFNPEESLNDKTLLEDVEQDNHKNKETEVLYLDPHSCDKISEKNKNEIIYSDGCNKLSKKKSKKIKNETGKLMFEENIDCNEYSFENETFEPEKNHKMKKKSRTIFNNVQEESTSVQNLIKQNQDLRIKHNNNNNNLNCENVLFLKQSKERKQKYFVKENLCGERVQEVLKTKQGKYEDTDEKICTDSVNDSKNCNELRDSESHDKNENQETILDNYISRCNDIVERKRLLREFKRSAVPEFNGFQGSNLYSVRGYGKSGNKNSLAK